MHALWDFKKYILEVRNAMIFEILLAQLPCFLKELGG